MRASQNKHPVPWALIIAFAVISPALLIGGIWYSSLIRSNMKNDRKIILTDLHRASPGHLVHPYHENGPDLIGLMILRINPGKSLYPLITKWSSRSKSSEMLLVVIVILAFGAVTGWTIWHMRMKFYRDILKVRLEKEALTSHFNNVLKYANDIIMLFDADFNIIEVNDRAVAVYQYSRDELLRMNIHRLRLPELRQEFEQNISRLRESGKLTYETIHRRNDGTTFPLEISARFIVTENKEFYQIIGRDITERKTAEKELNNSYWLLKSTIESTADGLLVVNTSGKIVAYNMKFARMWNIPDDILESKDDEKALSFVLDQLVDPEKFLKIVHELYALQEKVSFDTLEFKDGKVFERYSQPQWLDSTIVGRVWSFRDVTDKYNAERQLILAKEKAEESDRLKTAFLQNISHEIRTPMNAIVGFSALLDDPMINNETRKDYTEIITESTNQLLALISDIVEISNIETGQISLTYSEVNINHLLKDLYRQYSERSEKQALSFFYETLMPDEKALINTDKTKLSQILSHFLNNAFKFTRSGTIKIGYRTANDKISFYVSDTGIGIPEQEHEKIFTSFYQVKGDTSREFTGAGLGLTISKAYAGMLDCKIKVISAPGKGSEFVLSHPI